MSDWTTIPADTFETDRPVLGSTHLAIVENFSAMAEGAPGAPKVLGRALDKVYLGTLVRINSTSPIGFNDLEEVAGLLFVGLFRGLDFIEIRFSTDNGANWLGYQNLIEAEGLAYGTAHIDFATGNTSANIFFVTSTATNLNSNSSTQARVLDIPSGVNAFQIRVTSSFNSVGFRTDVFAIGGRA